MVSIYICTLANGKRKIEATMTTKTTKPTKAMTLAERSRLEIALFNSLKIGPYVVTRAGGKRYIVTPTGMKPVVRKKAEKA